MPRVVTIAPIGHQPGLVAYKCRKCAYATSNIDADARVAVASQIRMGQRVPLVSPVALAVWQILKDRRNGVLFGIVRQPDAGRQHRTVFQRYPIGPDYGPAEAVNRYA
jgi:hypothetical protein